MYELELLPQEQKGNSKFNGTAVMTVGFKEAFGPKATILAIYTLLKIVKERVRGDGADYLQICRFNGVKYWVIDDVSVVTFLLSEVILAIKTNSYDRLPPTSSRSKIPVNEHNNTHTYLL